jgi:hypothetical protein
MTCEACGDTFTCGGTPQPFYADYGDAQGRQWMTHRLCDPCAADLGLIEL